MAEQLAVSYECTPVRETNVLSEDRSPALAVLEIIAEVGETEPTELPFIKDTIDPAVINNFVTSTEADSEGALCFTYSGWNVFVRTDGTIVVGNPHTMSESTPLF